MDQSQPFSIDQLASETLAGIHDVLEQHRRQPTLREIGAVSYVGRGIARVTGLPGVQSEELLKFPGQMLGYAFNLDPDDVGVILLDHGEGLQAGAEVMRTGRLLDVAVGPELLGRVVDPVGRPLDRGGPIRTTQRANCERDAFRIMDRLPVTVPLQTGLKVIDALIPIGRGQRELILGDRQTGKTAIAIDTILNQRGTDTVSIYCAIGQRSTSVAKVIAELRDRGALDRCVVVVAEADAPPGLQFIAPYAATSIGEYFMEQGKDVVVVYDDLTTHARAYRELSLLLRRPPGREAFPGDIFYIHSRLLERSTRLRPELGGGSLTALPIAETEAENVAAYIPTNLISITDGQIYLSPGLFQKGHLPAVDVGRSVSRVGGKTQLPAYRAVAGDLRLSYSQFEELEAFSRFSSRLDEETQKTLERGRRVRSVLRQSQFEPLTVPEQVAELLSVTKGLFDAVPLARIGDAQKLVRHAVVTHLSDLCEKIEAGESPASEDLDRIQETARTALTAFLEEVAATPPVQSQSP